LTSLRSLAVLVALGLVAFPIAGADDAPPTAAHANIVNPVGTTLGSANFRQDGDGVVIEIDVIQQVPGPHGIHVLDAGKCDTPDFGSSGPHFNPSNKKHGFDNPEGPHAGDLRNLEAGPDGHAKVTLRAPLVTLGSGANSLFHPGGTSIVIDENPDDYRTDPDGQSGIHVACGIVVKD
jgi:superoxide dismutase, Cu-Zn family